MVSVVSATSVCQEDLPVGIFSGALGVRQFFKVVLKNLNVVCFLPLYHYKYFIASLGLINLGGRVGWFGYRTNKGDVSVQSV